MIETKSASQRRVSVCIPTFNGARYIEDTLRSIAEQTEAAFEVVISDDGSTDATIALALQYAAESGLNVRVVMNEARGPTQNYLNAIAFATGEVLMLADQDDPIHPCRIEKVTRALLENPDAVLVSSDSAIVDADLRPKGTTIRGGFAASEKLCRRLLSAAQFPLFLSGRLPFLAHTLAFRSEVKKFALAWPRHVPSFWLEEWLTAICAVAGRIIAIPDALTSYRQHESQLASLTGKDRRGASISTSDAIQNRVAKMRHLMVAIESNDELRSYMGASVARKSEELALYVGFLEFRLTLREGKWISLVRSPWSLRSVTDYFRYSRGVLSIASDVVQGMRAIFRAPQ